MASSPNPMDYFAVRNTLSRYCDALDTKDFNLLKEVFTEKVDAKYPFAHMQNVQVVADSIEKRYGDSPFFLRQFQPMVRLWPMIADLALPAPVAVAINVAMFPQPLLIHYC